MAIHINLYVVCFTSFTFFQDSWAKNLKIAFFAVFIASHVTERWMHLGKAGAIICLRGREEGSLGPTSLYGLITPMQLPTDSQK